jgi:hypothetical protein
MIKSLLGNRRLLIVLLTVAMLGGITIAQRTEVRAPVATQTVRTPSIPGAGANDFRRFNPNSTAGGNWKDHLDWAMSDDGAPDCADLYIVTNPECLAHGNRSCIMNKAIESAKAGNYVNAFRLALITECHNNGAQMDLARAGQKAVCEYLKTK